MKLREDGLKNKYYTYKEKNIYFCWTSDVTCRNGTILYKMVSWGGFVPKNGICVVKKTKKEEWIQRLNSLCEEIEYWINPSNQTNKTVETIQLFYDV